MAKDQPSREEIKAANERKAEEIAKKIADRMDKGGKPFIHVRERKDK